MTTPAERGTPEKKNGRKKRKASAPPCTFCCGCGWCYGNPALTCPRCNGTGEDSR